MNSNLNFGIESVNIRFFNQTGPRKKGDACADFVSKVAQIELGLVDSLIEVGNLNPYRDFTGIKDSLQGIWLIHTNGLLQRYIRQAWTSVCLLQRILLRLVHVILFQCEVSFFYSFFKITKYCFDKIW